MYGKTFWMPVVVAALDLGLAHPHARLDRPPPVLRSVMVLCDLCD